MPLAKPRSLAPCLILLTCFATLVWGQSSKNQGKPPKPTFRVGVETVFIKISVTDPLNRYVTGLEKEHFKVFEDKVEQTVSHFTQESAPISVGILFDISGSMKDNIHTARNSVSRYLKLGNYEVEIFMVMFHQSNLL